jgi:hypothetical protein
MAMPFLLRPLAVLMAKRLRRTVPYLAADFLDRYLLLVFPNHPEARIFHLINQFC